MNKYRLKSQIVNAKLYKRGMEDGWRLYYTYERYCYEPYENTQMVFKTLEALKTRKKEMIDNADDNNKIIFETPIPVIKTINGLEDVYEDEYIVTNEKGEVRLINKIDFDDMFEKCDK